MSNAHDEGRYSTPRSPLLHSAQSEGLQGWHELLQGYPWFAGEGGFPIAAYSEFMPPPRLGRRPYGEADPSLFAEDDPFGWYVTEIEEKYELQPDLTSLAHQILDQLIELGQGEPAYRIAGHRRRNLDNNPYWPPELAARAGQLPHERYVILLPLSLSRTQDDKARVRWTFFGGSEQGPELTFWKSFYSAPGEERPADEALAFLSRLLSTVYGETGLSPSTLHAAGLRILPTEPDSRFPYWHAHPLPSWSEALLWDEGSPMDGVRYLLTFRPFSRLPTAVRESYLAGQLVLLPFPGSLVFWGVPIYARLQQEMPMAMQLPLQRLAARNGGPSGIKVPQSGWFFESGKDFQSPQIQEKLLLNTYRRTSRWDRVRRYENEVVLSTIEHGIGRVLFGTELDAMGLYGKPMARNSQVWTEDAHLLLDGPHAAREELERAARVVAQGGAFRYRFEFPAMRVGLHEVYWQRPLVAYWSAAKGQVELLDNGPLGYLAAYLPDKPDLAHPVELWPRLLRREPYLWALRNFEHLQERYKHQTALNILRLLDTWRRREYKPLPRSFARQVLRLAEREPLETWLSGLPEKASDPAEGRQLQEVLENCLEPTESAEPHTSMPGVPPPADLPPAISYGQTATRAFEEAWWNDIRRLSGGDYVTRDNADSVRDPKTLALLPYRHRDLERLGDYLLHRHEEAIATAGMQGKALCGELPFHWHTDFDFSVFGGWKNDQEGHTYERDLLVIIPGRNRSEAVIMADHYDTAYMEDVYDPSRGGSGARLAAAGADDNYSATATLLQAAPIFLQLSKDGRLERDVWLVHLTGEEFPSDCMGARHLAQALVQRTLRLRLSDGGMQDLSNVRVVGVYVLDMIGHNRENDLDDFQISPGKGRASQHLAWHAHMANLLWNVGAKEWNEGPERRGKGRGIRSAGGGQIPPIAAHLRLQGEVRLNEDPRSSLFNTDGQIFSDCGVPVVLFMENYDINRSGYHDTKDTLENIDLDYGAAVAAIAIETVARVAMETAE
jgi:hypothetical protein